MGTWSRETARVAPGCASGDGHHRSTVDEKGSVIGTKAWPGATARSSNVRSRLGRGTPFDVRSGNPRLHPIKGQYTFVVPFGEATSSVSTVQIGQGREDHDDFIERHGRQSRVMLIRSPGGAWLKSAPSASALPPLLQPGSATIHVVVDKTGAVQSATPLKSDLPCKPYSATQRATDGQKRYVLTETRRRLQASGRRSSTSRSASTRRKPLDFHDDGDHHRPALRALVDRLRQPAADVFFHGRDVTDAFGRTAVEDVDQLLAQIFHHFARFG